MNNSSGPRSLPVIGRPHDLVRANIVRQHDNASLNRLGKRGSSLPAPYNPTLAATASIATGATALPRKPAKVWIEKARPSRTSAICAERIA
jgi:hypothetical protein